MINWICSKCRPGHDQDSLSLNSSEYTPKEPSDYWRLCDPIFSREISIRTRDRTGWIPEQHEVLSGCSTSSLLLAFVSDKLIHEHAETFGNSSSKPYPRIFEKCMEKIVARV